MGHIQTQEEWEVQMAEKILSYVRNELYLELRYLDVAFSALVPQADASLQSFATDGGHLFYSTEQVLRVFEKNALYLNRAYLHTVLHCIFSHPWIAGNRDRRLWNLACDVAVEYTIDGLGNKKKACRLPSSTIFCGSAISRCRRRECRSVRNGRR